MLLGYIRVPEDGFSLLHNGRGLCWKTREVGGNSVAGCKCLHSCIWQLMLLAGTSTGALCQNMYMWRPHMARPSLGHDSLRLIIWQIKSIPKKSQVEAVSPFRAWPWRSCGIIASAVITGLPRFKARGQRLTYWYESIKVTLKEKNVRWAMLPWPFWGSAMCYGGEIESAIIKVGLQNRVT